MKAVLFASIAASILLVPPRTGDDDQIIRQARYCQSSRRRDELDVHGVSISRNEFGYPFFSSAQEWRLSETDRVQRRFDALPTWPYSSG